MGNDERIDRAMESANVSMAANGQWVAISSAMPNKRAMGPTREACISSMRRKLERLYDYRDRQRAHVQSNGSASTIH